MAIRHASTFVNALADTNIHRYVRPAYELSHALAANERIGICGPVVVYQDVVGGFDEEYFLYFEETDLCHRARAAGWKVCMVPSAFVQHPKSLKRDAHVCYYMARNMYLFRTRHFGE